jgi:hypothetical protein
VAGIQLCERRDCAHPAEVVLVVVAVNVVEVTSNGPLQMALCPRHAEEALYLVDAR